MSEFREMELGNDSGIDESGEPYYAGELDFRDNGIRFIPPDNFSEKAVESFFASISKRYLTFGLRTKELDDGRTEYSMAYSKMHIRRGKDHIRVILDNKGTRSANKLTQKVMDFLISSGTVLQKGYEISGEVRNKRMTDGRTLYMIPYSQNGTGNGGSQ